MDAAAQSALKDALIAIPDINVESHTQHPQQPQGAAAAEWGGDDHLPRSSAAFLPEGDSTQPHPVFFLLLLIGRGHRRMSQPIKATESSLA